MNLFILTLIGVMVYSYYTNPNRPLEDVVTQKEKRWLFDSLYGSNSLPPCFPKSIPVGAIQKEDSIFRKALNLLLWTKDIIMWSLLKDNRFH